MGNERTHESIAILKQGRILAGMINRLKSSDLREELADEKQYEDYDCV
jgi:hypothetical protein